MTTVQETILLPKGKSHHVILKNFNITRVTWSTLSSKNFNLQTSPSLRSVTKIGMSLGDPEKVGLIFSSKPDSGPFAFPLFRTSDLVYTSVTLLFETDDEVEVRISYLEPTAEEVASYEGRSREVESWSASYGRPEKSASKLRRSELGSPRKSTLQ